MEVQSHRKLGLVLGCLALVLLLSTGVWAQGTGELTGVVYDPAKAVVPNAPVKLVNDATGVTFNTVTTAGGVYRFPSIPVQGSYTLTVAPKGFKSSKISGIVVSVGTIFTQDVHVAIGQATEVMNVEASAQTVQLAESQVSQLIDQRVWQTMPNSNRDPNSFMNLVAGSVPNAFNSSTRGASINGARGGAGNFMVDGLDNNDQGQGGRGQLGDTTGGSATSISPEAIQEYRVITNSFAAEYGKAGGFVTDTVLKSGTNKWHGALFEYNRVQALAANGFFSNRTADAFDPTKKSQDSLVRNQFGGSIGGPIKKDKTFFYLGTEIHRRRSSGSASGTGMNSDWLDWYNAGGFKTWAETDANGLCMVELGHTCPGAFAGAATSGPLFNTMKNIGPFPMAKNTATDIDSRTAKGFWGDGELYPMSPYATILLQDPSYLNEYRINAKFDHKFSDKDQVSALWLLQDDESGDPYSGGGPFPGPPVANQGRGQNVGITWNHSFSPTVLNSFKAGYVRHVSNFPEFRPGMPQIYTIFDPITTGFGMYSGLPQYFTDNQFQFQDNLSFMKGKHAFKTGWEYRRIRNGSSFFNDQKASYYLYDIESMISDAYVDDRIDQLVNGTVKYGSMYYASASVDTTTGQTPDPYRGFRANEFAGYFQDDWRINNRFTLNWGVRWEYFGPPHNFQKNIDSNFYFGNATTIPTCAPGQTVGCNASTNPNMPRNVPFYASVFNGTFQIRNNEIWNKDTNNFGPRLGFSWDALGNQKVVVRAGAGIMYDRIYNNTFENIRFNPPHFSDNQIGFYANSVPIGAIATPGIYTYPFNSLSFFSGTGARAPVPNPRHMDQNTVSPYYEQFHFGIQYEFAKGYVFEPEYVGTMGHKLMSYRDINTFNGRYAGGSTTRINPNIGADNYRSNDYSSNYHGFQATLRKTYSNGLQFNANYTWSKALDSISDTFNSRSGGATVSDTMNVKNDYGPADFDMRHRFVTTLSYELPFAKQNRFLGGWGLNTIISIQSGVAFTPYSSASNYDPNKDGLYNNRLVTTGGTPASTIHLDSSIPPGAAPFGGWGVTYFSSTGWTTYWDYLHNTCPTGAKFCDVPLGRNSIYGPGYQNVDFGLTKSFKFTERMKMQFQANFFNLFNHTNFGLPNRNANGGNFGEILGLAGAGNRETQLALRLDF